LVVKPEVVPSFDKLRTVREVELPKAGATMRRRKERR
jgi:hypothetical protein